MIYGIPSLFAILHVMMLLVSATSVQRARRSDVPIVCFYMTTKTNWEGERENFCDFPDVCSQFSPSSRTETIAQSYLRSLAQRVPEDGDVGRSGQGILLHSISVSDLQISS